MDRFPVPAQRLVVETRVKRSRFIATVDLATGRDAARAVVDAARAAWPDARHHCWACLCGPPKDLRHADKSDDGEPRDTAGRPILNALVHSGLGRTVVVVTRYFGGIKLGAGGLVRAYGQCAVEALSAVPTRTHFVTVAMTARMPYTLLARVEHYLDGTDVAIVDRAFGDDIVLTLAVPHDSLDETRAALDGLGQGAIGFGTAQGPGRERR